MKYYTDGSCRNNGKTNAVGAFGFIKIEDDETISAVNVQPRYDTTNQVCEMLAVLAACRDFQSSGRTDDVCIYSDSAYVINCYKEQWYVKWQKNNWLNSKKQPVANKEIWEYLIPFFDKPNYHFIKTKGHADDKYNNMIDEAVQQMSKEMS